MWLKGEISGDYQHVKKMILDFETDAILMFVKQGGIACHTGAYSCFFALFQED